MLIAIVPLLVALAGALVYALADGKPSTLGLWMFVVGLFWLVAGLAHKTIGIG